MSKAIDRESQEILELFRQRNYYRDTAVELLAVLKRTVWHCAPHIEDESLQAEIKAVITKAQGGVQ